MTEGATGSLGALVRRGAAVSAVGLVVSQLVIVVQTIVLGRLLGPHEVGVFAAGSVANSLLSVVAQSAMSQALVQYDGDADEAANTVLVSAAGTGTLLAGLLLVVSPLVGHLFGDHRIGLICAATAGIALLQSGAAVPGGLLQRAFRFGRSTVIVTMANVVFAAVAIAFAVAGYGAWSMVLGWYASTALVLVASWASARWRPHPGRFSARTWRRLARFSLPLVLAEAGDRARDAVVQVLVGRGLGTADLGQYRYANRISWNAPQAVVQIGGYVLLPAFSRLAGDAARFRQAFLRALGWIWVVALPAGALLVVVGEPLVVLLLGERWHPAGTATEAMAGAGPGFALLVVGTDALKGAGRTGLMNVMTATNVVLGIALVAVLLPLGLVGVGLALSATYLLVGAAAMATSARVVGVGARDLGTTLGPALVAAAAGLAAAWPLGRLAPWSPDHGLVVRLAAVTGVCLAFALVYAAVLRPLDPSRFREVAAAVRRRRA